MSEKLLPSTPCPPPHPGMESDGSCCCNCRWHARDYRHCSHDRKPGEPRVGCICGEQKGWVCLAPEFVAEDGTARVHSNWSEHGLCEMHGFVGHMNFTKRKDAPKAP